MSEGSLFNSGFLGASFNWWIGQIADDSTWRDNILPGKFESADEVPLILFHFLLDREDL